MVNSVLKYKLKFNEEKAFNVVNNFILTIVLIIVIYPLYFIIIASISDPSYVALGKVILVPKKITWDGYQKILEHKDIWIGYKNTLIYTAVGTVLNICLTITAAYALSRKKMPGRDVFMGIITFTMFFSGGLIPTYFVVQKLNLINKFSVMIIIGSVSVWNIIIARTFLQSGIPEELLDAATIDGCDDFKIFLKIILPISKAIIAVLAVYYAVGHWNEYFNGVIYLRDRRKYPLQLFLREILIMNQFSEDMSVGDTDIMIMQKRSLAMKYGLIIVSNLPMFLLYPFLQKYFLKGVMVGSIKG